MRILLLTCAAAVLAGWAGAEICVPMLECKQLLEGDIETLLAVDKSCTLQDGSAGVLCGTAAGDIGSRFGGPAQAPASSGGSPVFFPGQTSGGTNVADLQPLKSRFKDQQELTISSAAPPALNVVEQAQRTLAEVEQKVNQLATLGQNVAQLQSPEQLQLLFSRPQSTEAALVARSTLQNVQVLTDLKEQRAVGSKPFSTEQSFFGVGLQDRASFPAFPVVGDNKIPGCEIPKQKTCTVNDQRFRSHSGECNNLKESRLGKALTAFSRFFPAEYEDGIWKPRSSALGGGVELPSARLVSQRVVQTTPREDRFRTLSVMLYGQFVNHDMISTAAFTLPNGGGLFCCDRGNKLPKEPLHPIGCNPIPIPEDDPHYSPFGRTCMNQVRSLPAPFENCVAGPTGQLNQVSQYLDASNVYGSSKEEADKLRAFSGGLIKTSAGNLLPEENGRFLSGEGRNGENPGLTFMHTIWTREHNRVARGLAENHPDWDDERLYQEAKKITTGEYQNIVYNEYLPTVLGFKYTREHGLDPEFGHSFSYSPDFDPRITSEFSTAAFRFGHSQVQDAFILRAETGRILRTLAMEEVFFRGDLLKQEGMMRMLARSITQQKPREVDNSFSSSVHEKLFAGGGANGLDLIALNINRGRDHGLPSYVTALENCLERTLSGGTPDQEWAALEPFFEPDVLQRLRSVYGTIFDIDLYIGGVAERRKPGALVGEVFQCIIGEQFFAARYGDRFFYDNGDLPNSMEFQQVREIQQSSWARILCDNVEGLTAMQPLAFWQPSVFFNSLRRCNSFAIPKVDLSVF